MMAQSRVAFDRFFALCVFSAGLLTVSLFMVGLALVTFKGAGALSIHFLTQPMQEGGLAGGVATQLLGTAVLLVTTLVIVLPLSLGVALVRSVYLQQRSVFHRLCTVFLYTLNGIPSVLFGIFGFWCFVKALGWGKSWLAGGILLAMMILPTTALTLSEGMARIPGEYLEQARALGLRRSGVIWSVLVPQSLSSFVSGVLLGLARAAGETAPIMFTATVFSGAAFPRGVIDSPVLSLPYHIFNLAQESYQPHALQNAWGTAAVLVALAIGSSLLALPFRVTLHEEAAIS